MRDLGALAFNDLAPDQPDLGTHMEVANNCIPRANGYGPLPSLAPYSTAIPGSERAIGAESVEDEAGSSYTMVGTPTKLYIAAGTGWTDISRVTAYATADSWEFAVWEQRALMASAANDLQSWTFGAANAVDLIANIKASTIAVVRNQVLIGDVTDSEGHIPNKLRWCATNNPDDWTPSASTLSGAIRLESTTGGKILKVVGGEFGIVFLDRSIWRATFTGDSNSAYQLDEVEQGIQCLSAGGIVRYGGKAWYLAEDGFRVTAGGVSESIGEERVDSFVLADLDQSNLDKITASVLASEQTIVFAYPGAGSVGGVPNKLALYNTAAKKWSTGDESVYLLTRARLPFVSIEAIEALFGSIDNVPGSLDDPQWQGGGLQTVAIMPDGRSAFFTGPERTATFETAEIQHHSGQRTYVSEVRPLIEGSDLDIEVGCRATLGDAVVYTAPAPLNRLGVVPMRCNSRFMRYKATVRAPWSSAVGVQPFGAPAGGA